MATEREAVLSLLLVQCIKRLSKNGKQKVHITNAELNRLVEGNFEVDFSESNSDRFILKLVKGEPLVGLEEIVVEENVELPKELLEEQ
jgi:hypothetical protein